MMRDYQRSNNNPYWLPPTLYRRCLALVRDYERIRAERANIIYASVTPDGQPHGQHAESATERKAIRLTALGDDCEVVERALTAVPEEYREGLMRNIAYYVPMEDLVGAHRTTWSRWRQRFLYHIAKNSNWL